MFLKTCSAMSVLALLVLFSLSSITSAADRPSQRTSAPTPPALRQAASQGKREAAVRLSPVTLDGNVLFSVRGLKSFSSEERAKAISERLKTLAENLSVGTGSVITVDTDISTDVVAGEKMLLSVTDGDALPEGRTRKQLAEDCAGKIRAAVDQYRMEFSRESILYGVLFTAVATVVSAALLVLLYRLFRKVSSLMDTRFKERIPSISFKSIKLVEAERVAVFINVALRGLRLVLVLVLAYSYLHLVLSFFPWTRPFADRLLYYVLAPLSVIGRGILDEIPHLFFIAVIVIISRYVLKFIHVIFRQVERGTVTIKGFYPEWAEPTEKLLTIGVIAFAAVVAFPYIPGSSSPAFKGISIFLGVLFSLGSQSAVANSIAGIVMTYRRAFAIGDRIQTGDITGDVVEMRHQVTVIRTLKNEEAVIPNSTLVNSNIINYSAFARDEGLILHTTVTIGYDAPWRQVHALLLLAAGRTPGTLREPSPFILQKSLDDFYVIYELNVYTNDPQAMPRTYSNLHKNIQDAFNEFGVQIMSPNYRFDPEKPKVVPKARWYEPPAKPDYEPAAGQAG